MLATGRTRWCSSSVGGGGGGGETRVYLFHSDFPTGCTSWWSSQVEGDTKETQASSLILTDSVSEGFGIRLVRNQSALLFYTIA
jgi:hypothetical protein